MKHSFLLIPISAMMMASLTGASSNPLQRVDRQFIRPALQSVRPPLPGRLDEDGEGSCAELPYSACGYTDGAGNHFYFNEGRLVVKEYSFAESPPGSVGPFGIRRADRQEVARRKIRAVTGRADRCVPVGAERVCFTALSRNTRVDLRFGADGRVQRVTLSVSDFL